MATLSHLICTYNMPYRSTYWAGGVSKILLSAEDWVWGATLQAYAYEYQQRCDASSIPDFMQLWCQLGYPMRSMLIESQIVASTSAWLSLLFELLAPVVLFAPSLLPFFGLAATLFHTGIKLLLHPDFAPQVLVLVIVLGLVPHATVGTRGELKDLKRADYARGLLGTGFVFGVLITCLWLRTEYYPFSTIAMYAVKPASVVGADGVVMFSSQASLQHLVDMCTKKRLSVCYQMFMAQPYAQERPQSTATTRSCVPNPVPISLTASLFECPSTVMDIANLTQQCHMLVHDRPWHCDAPECSGGRQHHPALEAVLGYGSQVNLAP